MSHDAPTAGWIVDCDPTLGVRGRDVDDALAIYALLGAGVDVAALTTVYGNADLDTTTRVATELGARWSIPVFRGAAATGAPGGAAVDRLVAHRGPVLGLGPCTNLAAALARGASWSALVLLGGTRRRGPNVRYLHLTELNFALDTAAAASALRRATRVIPMEVCRTVVYTRANLVGLPAWMVDACESWLRLAPWLTGTGGFHPWDVIAALAAVDPEMFVWSRQTWTVDHRPWRRGAFLPGDGPPVEVAEGVDPVALKRAWHAATKAAPAFLLNRTGVRPKAEP